MSVRYTWTTPKAVSLAIATHDDGILDTNDGVSVDPGNVALGIATDEAFMIEARTHDELLELIERMRTLVLAHKEVAESSVPPKFSSIEEADAWFAAREKVDGFAPVSAVGGGLALQRAYTTERHTFVIGKDFQCTECGESEYSPLHDELCPQCGRSDDCECVIGLNG